MSTHADSRKILVHGLALVLAGLVWGLVIPHTPHPRLALGAHIQFTTNGMLILILALLVLKLPHGVGAKSLRVMLLAAWLTWPMALSEAVNAWWGTTQMLSISATQAGATGGEPWQELVLKLTHMAAALALIAAWTLLVAGFLKSTGSSQPPEV